MSKWMVEYLSNIGKSVVWTNEPWIDENSEVGFSHGKEIREILSRRKSSTPEELLLLFLTARLTHNEWIRNQLENNKIVVCDRYSLSTYVYQSECISNRYLLDFCTNKEFNICPDKLIYLDVDLEVSKYRRKERLSDDIFDKDENQSLIIQRYKYAAAKINESLDLIDANLVNKDFSYNRFAKSMFTINASRTFDEVKNDVKIALHGA